MNKEKTMNLLGRIQKTLLSLSLATIALCLVLLAYFFYFVVTPKPSENMLKHELLKNRNVTEVKTQETEPNWPFHNIDTEIKTEDGYEIRLLYVSFPFVSKKIYVTQINGIVFSGGRTYKVEKNEKISYTASDAEILGQMLGIRLKSAGDIVHNVGKLHDLFKLLESNSGKEFTYREKFLVKAEFGWKS